MTRRSTQPNEQVRQIQMALQEKGFDPGRIDGVMGRKTSKALSQFQRQQNLFASGQMDPTTSLALGVQMPTEDNSLRAQREKPGQKNRSKPSAAPDTTHPENRVTEPEDQTTPEER